jgi:glutamate/aspartate transport system permease protein
MAYRIILPPLTSESMNLLKNSSVAFAVSIAELTMFAMQAQEETSRGIEVYLAVTACTWCPRFIGQPRVRLHREEGADPGLHRRPAAGRPLTWISTCPSSTGT